MKKKVCIIRAGDVTYISRIHRTALALQESDRYDVSIICIEPRYVKKKLDYLYHIHSLPIKSRKLKGKLFFFIRVIEGITRVFFEAKKQKADLYIAITVDDLIIAFLIAKVFKKKLVYNANELEADRKIYNNIFVQKIYNKTIRRIEGFILPKANCCIAADFERAKIMEKWYKLENVETIRNVPLYFHDSVNKQNLIKEKLYLDDTTKILLYQGIISLGRGIEASIIASAKVNNEQFALVLLGDVDLVYKSYLIKIAESNNFNRLFFISAVPWYELLQWTSSADISLVLIENISLSYFLAAPNKIYESIMAEVPYIASDFPEINRVHNIAKAGILVNPEDIDEIAGAINIIINDSVLVNNFKQNANKAKQIFNWEKEKIKLLNIIDHL